MSSEIINFLRKSNVEQATLDKIITQLHKSNPIIKGDPKKVSVKYAQHVRRRTSNVTTGTASLIKLENRERTSTNTTWPRIKESFQLLKSNPLTQTEVGTLTFTAQNHKFGGAARFNASSYLTIPHEPLVLAFTDAVTMAMYYYLEGTQNGKVFLRKGTGVSTEGGWTIQTHTPSGAFNPLRFGIRTDNAGGTAYFLDSDNQTTDVWHSVVCTWDNTSNNMRLWIDGTEQTNSPVATSGSLQVSTNGIGVGATHAGLNTLLGSLSWVHVFNAVVDGTWATNFHNGIIDRKNKKMIISWPFIQDKEMRSRATSGLFQSKT